MQSWVRLPVINIFVEIRSKISATSNGVLILKVSSHEDMICIKPPKQKGDKIEGKTIEAVKIENNQWLFICL